MRHVLLGLSAEAREYLSANRIAVGDPCPCCGQAVFITTIPIAEIQVGREVTKLYRYILREPDLLVEEFLQRREELLDRVDYYLGLRSPVSGRVIQWY